jgi:diguanylate cyclase (GGDEF)-like protein/PAS domain S-box-containing protein
VSIKTKLLLIVIIMMAATAIIIGFAFTINTLNQSKSENIERIEIAKNGFISRFNKIGTELDFKYKTTIENKKINRHISYVIAGGLLEFHMLPLINSLSFVLGVDDFAFYYPAQDGDDYRLHLYHLKSLSPNGNVEIINGRHKLYVPGKIGSQEVDDPTVFSEIMPTKQTPQLVYKDQQLQQVTWHPFSKGAISNDNATAYFRLGKNININFDELEKELGVKFNIYNLTGKRIFGSVLMSDLQLKQSSKNLSEITELSITTGELYDALVVPLSYSGHLLGYASIGISQLSTQKKIQSTLFVVLFIFVVSIAIILLISIKVIDYLIRPIERLATNATKMAEGDLNVDIEVSGNDEISILADNFRLMRDATNETLTELKDKNAVLAKEISERKQIKKREQIRNQVLEQLLSAQKLPLILTNIIKYVEEESPLSLCSILLMDKEGKRLLMGAAPSLPEFYNNAINGIEIGEETGSCGTAAFHKKRIIVADIQHHPYWDNYKDLAAQANLASCWSEPIRGSNNKVLGTFAIYHRQPCTPNQDHIALIEMISGLVAVVIERTQSHDRLQLLSRAYDQTHDGITITDANNIIVDTNPAFSNITGFNREEVVGFKPKILNSGKQNAEFYEEMWRVLNEENYWQGELWNRTKDGNIFAEQLTISALQDEQGITSHYIGVFSDITKRKQDEDKIHQLANYDALTNLPNRTLLDDRIKQSINFSQRNERSFAVLFLDLDHFKNVNDSLGHHIGDLMLIEVAKRLMTVIRKEDTVSRIGGDEFILLLQEIHADGAAHLAQKVNDSLSAPYILKESELSITPSIGIALYPMDGDNPASLLQAADSAMYQAKDSGRNRFQFFTKELFESTNKRLEIDNALRGAINRQELSLHYQPQFNITSGKLIGCEALLRWTHPKLGPVSPAEFIPIAEDSGLILAIDRWVLHNAVKQLAVWKKQGMLDFTVSVNLSAAQFHHQDLVAMVKDVLSEHQVSAQHLELELTEGLMMEQVEEAISVIELLHEKGIKLSIDDFGTGYSSLSYLKRFKIDKLKIDQSFVRDIASDPDDAAIVSTIVALANSLDVKTIAEGVETKAQQRFLSEIGCHEMQGYLYSRPLPVAEFEDFIVSLNEHPIIKQN